MGTVGNITVNLEAQTASFTKEVESAKQSLSGFSKIAQQAKAFNIEAKQSGEGAVEKLLKGGGALGLISFAVEGIAKAAEGLQEALRGISDGSLSMSEGIGKAVEKTADGIPVLGSFVKAFRQIEDTGADIAAGIADKLGFDKDFVNNNIRSAATVKANAEQVGKAVDAAQIANRKSQDDLAEATLKGTDKAKFAAEKAHKEKMRQLDEEQKKALEQAGGDDRVKGNVGKTFAQARINEDKALQATITEIDRKALEDREKLQSEHEDRLADIQDRGLERQLKDQGRDLDAELVALQRGLEKQENEIDKRAKEQAKDKPQAERADIFANADKEKAALRANEGREEADAIKADNDKKIDEQRTYQERLNDIKVEGAEESLRAAGKAGEAEILALRTTYAKQIAEIDKATKEKTDKYKEDGSREAYAKIQGVQAQAAAEKAALKNNLDQKVGKTNEDDAKKKQDEQLALGHKLTQGKIETLRIEAEYGNKLAGFDADRLEKVEAIKSKREELLKTLRDEKDLTSDQKKDIADQVAALDRAEKRANEKKKSYSNADQFAESSTRRFDGGVPGNVNNSNLDTQTKVAQQSLTIQQQDSTRLQDIWRKFTQNTTTAVVDF